MSGSGAKEPKKVEIAGADAMLTSPKFSLGNCARD